jgi:hypothetical protein
MPGEPALPPPPDGRVWTLGEPLSELSLPFDWDSVASMIGSLRVYALEHGSIPVWNFTFCGGRPELAVPFSWAWTWPSLFAYLLPPNPAILAVWALLTAAGALATRALLLRWTGDSGAAALGALLYAGSGYFGAHFNVGHASFAFLHLVPVAMALFEAGLARRLRGEPARRAVFGCGLGAFLFATAGLPHALLHFYPAFAALVVLRAVSAARAQGLARAARALRPLLVAHALGLGLAAYKLWPALRWQLDRPRPRAFSEAHGLLEVLADTLRFVPAGGSLALQPWLELRAWEQHAFVGPGAWALAALALGLAAGRARPGPQAGVAAWAAALVATGVALALGNGHPASPARVFGALPLLDGVRAFGRYQVLTILGLATLAAQGFAALRALTASRPALRWLPAALFVATAGPVAAQAAGFVWNLSATRNEAILAWYGSPPRPDPPQLMGIARVPMARAGHQTALLERGYWIANCYENLTLPGGALALPEGARVPLTDPAPTRLSSLGRDRLELELPRGGGGFVEIELRVPEGFETSAPAIRRGGPRIRVRRGDVAGDTLAIAAAYRGPREGALASAAAAIAALGLGLRFAGRSGAPD